MTAAPPSNRLYKVTDRLDGAASRQLSADDLVESDFAEQFNFLIDWFLEYHETLTSAFRFSGSYPEQRWRSVGASPVSPRIELALEFGDLVSPRLLEKVFTAIEENSPDAWIRKSDAGQHAYGRKNQSLEEAARLASRAQTEKKPLNYGTQDEVAARAVLESKLQDLDLRVAQLSAVHGFVGHNQPSSDSGNFLAVEIARAIRESNRDLIEELRQPKPDVARVASAGGMLQFLATAGKAGQFAVSKGAGGVLSELGKQSFQSHQAVVHAILGVVQAISKWVISLLM